jgi:UDP-glucose 4-epimerase
MKCIVTGGAGFIGSHLVDYLLEEGAEVKIIDDLSTGNEDNINASAEFICEDLNSIDLKEQFKSYDYVFHLAALPRIQPSFEFPMEHHIANIDVTLKILEAAKETGIKKVVYSGSSSIYGNPEGIPTSENEKVNNLNPYSLQKYTSEQYGLLLGKNWDLPFISLRYFNPYGPRSYNPKNKFSAYSSVIGIFQDDILNKKKLKITGDGSQARDFIYVKDLAVANVKAALSDVKFDCFNVGYGQAHTINEIAEMFNVPYEYIDLRKGEAEITLANIDKIRTLLDWEPSIKVSDYISEWTNSLNH